MELGEFTHSEFSVRLNGPILRATYTRSHQAILGAVKSHESRARSVRRGAESWQDAGATG
jgi:hypothetical protein